MKALSLRQYPLPYASLVSWGLKENETRSLYYFTDYRGQIAIHAAKQKEPIDFSPLHSLIRPGNEHYYEFGKLQEQAINLRGEGIPYGCIVCVAELTDCIIMTDEIIEAQTPLERAVGFWEPGQIALKLEKIKRLSNPIPIPRGWQAWGRTTPEMDELIFKDKLVHALSH